MTTLTERFYEMWQDGFIYDDDPDNPGMGMSYGELAAVSAEFDECIQDAIDAADTFEEALANLKEVTDNGTAGAGGDDVSVFYSLDEFIQNLFYNVRDTYFEDEETGEFGTVLTIPDAHYFEDKCPYERLVDLWEEYKDEHEHALELAA